TNVGALSITSSCPICGPVPLERRCLGWEFLLVRLFLLQAGGSSIRRVVNPTKHAGVETGVRTSQPGDSRQVFRIDSKINVYAGKQLWNKPESHSKRGFSWQP